MPPRPSSAQAYESLLPELLAIPDEQLRGARLDVTAAITAVARLLSSLRALGPTLDASRGFDFEQLDRLELCTLALHHAESRCRRLPDDSLCALIRHKASTLFLQAHDDLRYALQQLLLDPPPLPMLRGAEPQSVALERRGDPGPEDEPAPLTLVSLRAPERAVA